MTAATDSLQIRDATRDDIAKIAQWNTDMALETENLVLDPDTITAGVTALFDHPERGFYLVATLDGEAWRHRLFWREWSDWRNGMFWWIQSVYVPSAYRRSGVFRSLYRQVESLVREDQTACGLRLYVEKNNARAIQTYRSLEMYDPGYLVMESLAKSNS